MNSQLHVAFDFIGSHHVLSLAVCCDDGPHCCSLMYVHSGFDFYWVSDPASRHSQVIDSTVDIRAAVTIAPDYAEFGSIRGLQMTGTAMRVNEIADSLAAMALFGKRYSFFAALGARPGALAAAMLKAKVYRFAPDTLTLIDNTVAFGSKATFGPDDFAVFAAPHMHERT